MSYKMKEDGSHKDFYRNPRRFCALINGVLFEGKQVLRKEHIKDADTDLTLILDHHEYINISKRRDVVKEVYIDNCKVMIGIEGQHKKDNQMPLRAMVYDALEYEKQRKRKEGYYPVITIILHDGDESWEKPLSLSDMMDVREDVKAYFQDYQMILVNISDINAFHIADKEVREVILAIQMAREEKDYRKIFERYTLTKEAMIYFAGVVGMDNIEEYISKASEGGENMYQTLKMFIEENKEEGRKEGHREGHEEGIIYVARNIMKTQNVDCDTAMSIMDLSQKEKDKYRHKILT